MHAITGYHGTSRTNANRILAKLDSFKPSANDGDWLGYGVYFWEDAPVRAKIWAQHRFPLEPIEVLSASVDLTFSLDLFDVTTHRELRRAYVDFVDFEYRSGLRTTQPELRVEVGRAFTSDDRTSNPLLRKPVHNYRDRAFIDWYISVLKARKYNVTSVRGVFLSGHAVCRDSYLFDWSHSQISVIDPGVLSDVKIHPLVW
jgi:hypothetical protein